MYWYRCHNIYTLFRPYLFPSYPFFFFYANLSLRIRNTNWMNRRSKERKKIPFISFSLEPSESSECHSSVTRTSLEPSVLVFIHRGIYRCNDTNTLFTPYPYTSHPNFLTQNLLLQIWYTDWIEKRSSQRNLPITRTSIESTFNIINNFEIRSKNT